MPERPRELSAEQALYELLLSLYADDGEGLIRFLQFGEQGDDIAASLPGGDTPISTIAGRAVVRLKTRGLVDLVLFDRLEANFPRRTPVIREVRARWEITSGSLAEPKPRSEKQERAADEFFRKLLHDAEQRKHALQGSGHKTEAVDAEILGLKRQIRQGHPLGQGNTLGGRYLLLDQVGEGGFGTVWRARDATNQQIVAVKVLHAQDAHDVSKRERFFRGARAMQRLDHPAVVRIYEPERSDGDHHFFVMEFVDGIDLDRAIRDKKLGPAQVVPVVVEIGWALARAHERGMVHRDVKPPNILIDRMGRPRLTDFDLVRAADTTGGTREGGMGTVVYSAPEMYRDAYTADARADVFSLGMTAVFAFFGKTLPLEVLRSEQEVFSRLTCAASVKHVLAKAIQWDASARYAKMTDFCDALAKAGAVANAPAPAPRTGWLELAVLLTVALLVLGFVFYVLPLYTMTVVPGDEKPPPEAVGLRVALPGQSSVVEKPPQFTNPVAIPSEIDPEEVLTGPVSDETGATTTNAEMREPIHLPPKPRPKPKQEEPRSDSPQVEPPRPNPRGEVFLGWREINNIARTCIRDSPGAYCQNAVDVVITVDANGVIVGSQPQGVYKGTILGTCIQGALMKFRFSTPDASGKLLKFPCR